MPSRYLAARDAMSMPVFVVSGQDSVAYVRDLMAKHRISRVPVMDNGRLVGMLTVKDIAYRMNQPGEAWRSRTPDRIPAAEFATPAPVVVGPDTLLRTIAGIFLEKKISGVPVVENGRVVGIVTKTDLMKSALAAGLKGTVRDATEDAVTVSRWDPLYRVVPLLKEHGGALVVTNNDGSVAGFVTEENLAFRGGEKPRPGGLKGKGTFGQRTGNPDEEGRPDRGNLPSTAGDVMTSPAVTVAPVSPLPHAIQLMISQHAGTLAVVEHTTLVGILKRDAIVKEVAK